MLAGVEAVELAGVNKSCSGKTPEIIRLIETRGLFETDADFFHSISHELRADKALFSVPFNIEINSQKSENIIGIDIVIADKVIDDAVIFSLLSRGHRYPVYLAWDHIKFSESTFANDLLIKRSRQRRTAVCTAEAIHFRELLIARK